MKSTANQNNIIIKNSELWKDLEYNEIRYWSTLYKAAKSRGFDPAEINYSEEGDIFSGWMKKIDILAFNRSFGIGLNQPVDHKTFDRIINQYKAAGIPRFFLQVNPAAKPLEIHSLLLSKGFTHHNNWVKLYRDRTAHIPAVKTNLTVERVKKETAGLFGKIIIEAFNWPVYLKDIFASSVGEPGYHHYFATLNDIPVAAAALYIHDKYASMAIAGTLPHFRGQGAQNLLLTQRLKDAMDSGCEHFVSETAEETVEKQVQSFRNMRKLGFEIAYKRPNYIYYT